MLCLIGLNKLELELELNSAAHYKTEEQKVRIRFKTELPIVCAYSTTFSHYLLGELTLADNSGWPHHNELFSSIQICFLSGSLSLSRSSLSLSLSLSLLRSPPLSLSLFSLTLSQLSLPVSQVPIILDFGNL